MPHLSLLMGCDVDVRFLLRRDDEATGKLLVFLVARAVDRVD